VHGAWSNQEHAPFTWRRFTCEAHAPQGCSMRSEHAVLPKKSQFCDVFAPKAYGLAQVQVKTFSINIAFLFHNFSFVTGKSSRERRF